MELQDDFVYSNITSQENNKETLRATMALSQILQSRSRVRIWQGAKGKIWDEMYDILGYIGRTSGPEKSFLIVHNSKSSGGSIISPETVVGIKVIQTNQMVYWRNGYTMPVYTIRLGSWSPVTGKVAFNVVNECNNSAVASNCTQEEAEHICQFMTGQRFKL